MSSIGPSEHGILVVPNAVDWTRHCNFSKLTKQKKPKTDASPLNTTQSRPPPHPQSLAQARDLKVMVLNRSFVRPNFPLPASMHMPTRVRK